MICLVDFSALEEKLIRSPGADRHTEAARALFGTSSTTPEQRRVAKSWNYMKAYGASDEDFVRYVGQYSKRSVT